MKTNKLIRSVIIIAIILLNIGCDQVSKSLVRSQVEAEASFRFLHDHFMLTRVENTGAFLSIGAQIPGFLHFIILDIFPAAALILAIAFLIRKSDITSTRLVGICFIIGGGAGNIYDRIAHGSVTDFLYIDFEPFHTGVFNLADVSIMVGMFLVLLALYLKRTQPVAASPGKEELTS